MEGKRNGNSNSPLGPIVYWLGSRIFTPRDRVRSPVGLRMRERMLRETARFPIVVPLGIERFPHPPSLSLGGLSIFPLIPTVFGRPARTTKSVVLRTFKYESQNHHTYQHFSAYQKPLYTNNFQPYVSKIHHSR